jgi:hypothetical protein
VPQLLGAKRRLADGGEFGDQFRPVQSDQIPPAVRQLDRRRVEPRRLGENAGAFGFGQIGGVAHLPGHALLIAA